MLAALCANWLTLRALVIQCSMDACAGQLELQQPDLVAQTDLGPVPLTSRAAQQRAEPGKGSVPLPT